MKKDEFFEFGTHFCNISPDLMEGYFDWDYIENELDVKDLYIEDILFTLSQFIVGNVSEPMKELLSYDSDKAALFIDRWIRILNNESELKSMAFFINEYAKCKAKHCEAVIKITTESLKELPKAIEETIDSIVNPKEKE